MLELIGKAYAQIGVGNLPGTLPMFTGTDFRGLVVNVINGVLIIAGILAVLFLVYGGIMYTTAGANSDQADKGKTVIVNAIIGLVIIFAALIIVRVVSSILQSGTA